MPVRIATASWNSNAFLGGGGQHRIAFLCDGSLAVLYHNGSAWALIQVVNPGSATPTVLPISGYPGQTATGALPDMHVLNSGTSSSELWFTDTQTKLAVVHATYAAGGSGWSWSPRTVVAASSTSALWSQIIWTGTYLVELHQDSKRGRLRDLRATTRAIEPGRRVGWQPSSSLAMPAPPHESPSLCSCTTRALAPPSPSTTRARANPWACSRECWPTRSARR